MTRVFARPYLQADSVTAGPWFVTMHGVRRSVPDYLPAWDYETPLRFDSEFIVERSKVLAECGLPENASIGVGAIWTASSTNVRRLGAVVKIEDDLQGSVEFDVDPSLAGGRLTLQRQVILLEPTASGTPLGASQKGSILWEEERAHRVSVILEGDSARFPTEMADFSNGLIADRDSSWRIEIDLSELDVTPLSTLRLYLNRDKPEIAALAGGDGDLSGSAIMSVLSWDVGRRMINAALDQEDFVHRWGTFSPGSTGEVIQTLISSCWPGHDAGSLKVLRSDDPGLFEARLQGKLALFRTAK